MHRIELVLERPYLFEGFALLLLALLCGRPVAAYALAFLAVAMLLPIVDTLVLELLDHLEVVVGAVLNGAEVVHGTGGDVVKHLAFELEQHGEDVEDLAVHLTVYFLSAGGELDEVEVRVGFIEEDLSGLFEEVLRGGLKAAHD